MPDFARARALYVALLGCSVCVDACTPGANMPREVNIGCARPRSPSFDYEIDNSATVPVSPRAPSRASRFFICSLCTRGGKRRRNDRCAGVLHASVLLKN